MSKMFLAQTQKHLDQLDAKINAAGEGHEEELKQLGEWSKVAHGKTKSMLEKQIVRLKKAPKIDVSSLKVIRAHVAKVHELIVKHPSYNKTRNARKKARMVK
jgi:hypothetical protein